MEAIFEASWRVFPAAVLAAAGALLILRGFRREVFAHRMAPRDPGKALTMVQGVRIIIIGLSVAALALGWIVQQPWIAILALIIMGQETLETSIVIFGLTKSSTLRLRP